MIYKYILLTFLSFTFIYACSKNDSSENNSCTGTSLGLKKSSYENFKEIDLTPQIFPNGLGRYDTVAYADFNQDGFIDIFGAILTYWPPTTQEAATDSKFGFYINNCKGDFEINESYFTLNETCIHPRKALINDFNNDGIPDVFVICHGWDKNPFPGEKNKILLSSSLGKYDLRSASSDIGFYHSGSSYDYNNDGYMDVLAVDSKNSNKIVYFKNDGNGSFLNDGSSRAPTVIANKNYFTAELIDINDDNHLDLFVGGHEWEYDSITQIYLNPGNDNFSSVIPDNISAISNEGVVLDFTVTKKNSSTNIWILRTSGGDGTFYQSRTIQRVSWPTLSSSTLVKDRNLHWIPWIIPSVIDGKNVITSDNKDNYFTLEY